MNFEVKIINGDKMTDSQLFEVAYGIINDIREFRASSVLPLTKDKRYSIDFEKDVVL